MMGELQAEFNNRDQLKHLSEVTFAQSLIKISPTVHTFQNFIFTLIYIIRN